jgi:hypothetical protein
MQIRCTYCQTMFAVNHDEMLAALEQMEEEKLKFYDAHCPKCRRANRIERLKLEFAYPDWKDDLKKMASTTAGTSQEALPGKMATPAPKAEAPAAPGRKKHAHKAASSVAPKVAKTGKDKPAPAKAKVTPKGKPVAKTAKKPVVKPAPKAVKKPVKKPVAGKKKK